MYRIASRPYEDVPFGPTMPTDSLITKLYSDIEARPELLVLRSLPTDGQATRQYLDEFVAADTTGHGSSILSNWIRAQGGALVMARQYQSAISKFTEAMRVILGPVAGLPTAEYSDPRYLAVFADSKKTYASHLDLTACCNGIAKCYFELGNLVKALDWLHEVDIIYDCQKLANVPDAPPWSILLPPLEEHHGNRIQAAALYSRIFEQLGNTASSFYFANKCVEHTRSLHPSLPVHRFIEGVDYDEKSQRRHPEPSLIDKWEVTHPSLQVRGAWKQIPRPSGARPPSRHGFASWIWRSKIYVAGGQRAVQNKLYQDLWCLDLVTMGQWRRLPDCPIKLPSNLPLTEWLMKLWDNKAWLFIDVKELWSFDLIKEEWKLVHTTYPSPHWSQIKYNRSEYFMEIFEAKMYIFGYKSDIPTGTNLFMSLDMEKLSWECLGGNSDPEFIVARDMPALRERAGSWIVPEQKRLYILFGQVLPKQTANVTTKNPEIFNYEDMWSYSIPERTWRRERLTGNIPSPRSEFARAYNPKLGKVAIYGGSNSTVPTYDPTPPSTLFHFALYGDVFLLDTSTRSWSHVLTRGFPSYRVRSLMLVDEDTGKFYIYGGYTNSSFVPSKHLHLRSFGDIWQLVLDLPGGGLEEVDLVQDSRSPKMGPWKRCFTCGSTSTNFRKCGGMCDGKFFFCSTNCQRKGWQEHKQTHGCRKR